MAIRQRGLGSNAKRARFLGGLGAAFGAGLALRAGAAEAYTLRMNVATAATSASGLAALRFAAAVARRTNGQVTVEVYPSLQLGTERESIDGLVGGVLDLAIQNTTYVAALAPKFQVFDMPFLFRNAAAAYKVFDGAVGEEFRSDLEGKGIVLLAWGTGGFKELETSTRAVSVPDDMKGLRIRIQSGATFAAMYQAMGAIPVTIDLSEAFTALTQHTVDGLDVTVDSFVAAKYYTVAKHVAAFNHVFSVIPLLASKRKFDGLPPGLQRVLREEGRALTAPWRALVADRAADAVKTCKDNGVAFTEIQYPAFRKLMDPVYAAFGPRIGSGLIERIGRAAG